MKQLIYITTVVLLFTSLSCKKMLDVTPTDFVTEVNYYNNENDVNIALAGVYDILGRNETYGKNLICDLTFSDEGFYYSSGTTSGTPMVYNFDVADPTVLGYWRVLYQGIDRANVFLENIDRVPMDETRKKAAKGEVLFLRGYFHFLLVRDFGDVPLKLASTTSVNETVIARTPAKEVYAQIIKDMTEAEGLVKSVYAWGYSGHVSKSAVRGILARVNLTMAGEPLKDVTRYEEALKWAKKVDEEAHSLNPDYKQIFINIAQDKYDVKESIWEVEFQGNRASGPYVEQGRVGNLLGVQCTDKGIGVGYGLMRTTPKIYNLYTANDTSDVRRDWNICPYSYVGTTKTFYSATDLYSRPGVKFYREYETLTPKYEFGTPQNWPILRYADVLLMMAEAENEMAGPTQLAHQCLNKVRARAKTFEYKNASVITDKAVFRQAVRDERAREFAFEGMRKYDLLRYGTLVSEIRSMAAIIRSTVPAPPTNYSYAARVGDVVSDRHTLLPIPQLEISLNPAMTQNKGW